MSSSLADYLRTIRAIPLLTAAEELHLDRAAVPLSREALAAALGTSPLRLVQVLNLRRCLQPLSLDGPIAPDRGEVALLETVDDQRRDQIEEAYDWLHDQLLQLGRGERLVLELRYLSEERSSIARIAARTGMSRSQIARCEQRALRKLRHRVWAQPC